MGVERALSSKGRYRVDLKREWDLGETPKLNVERSPFELRVRMSIFEKKEKMVTQYLHSTEMYVFCQTWHHSCKGSPNNVDGNYIHM